MSFGVPAVIAAFVGSYVLLQIPDADPLFSYSISDKNFDVYPVKFMISILLIIFALMDLLPIFQKMQFGKKWLPVGGVLSGFFGGLSGNQGALRSAFLIKAGLSKEAFIGTAVVVSTFVDFTRLGVYATQFTKNNLIDNIGLVLLATAAGILGSFFGNKLLKKITIQSLRIIVAVMLILISVALGSGLI